MKKSLIFPFFILFLFAQNASAIELSDSVKVKLIDLEKLNQLVDSSKAKVNWVIIYTNNCGGTSYILKDAIELKAKYQDNLNVILCSSEPMSKIKDVEELMIKFNIHWDTYIIDGSKFKEKKSDDRYKGFDFRNSLCKSCHVDPIGVPYSFLIDDKQNVIFSGYPVKNDISALIKYIIE